MLFFCVLVCFLEVGFFAAPAAAQIRLPEGRQRTAPPEPRAATAKVRRGESVEIPLEIFGSANQQAQFRIKTKPQSGTLSEPRITGRDSAVVVYRHSGKAGALHDRFTFVVQTAAGFSTPAAVDITIEEDPAILAVPDEIDFGSVKPGLSAELQITIENRGGSVVEGKVEAPDGWKVKEAPDYRLDMGEKKQFTIIFSPTEERIYRGELRYTSSVDRVTLLRGEGAPPYALRPAKLELRAPAGSLQRSGTLTIENRTDELQLAHVTAGKQLRVSEEQQHVWVPANGKVPITVDAAAEGVWEFDDKLSVEIADVTLSADVHVAAVGAIVRVSAGRLSLGTVQVGTSAGGTLQIENAGGSPAKIEASIGWPFSVGSEDQLFTLGPGAKRALRVSVQPIGSGKWASNLKLKTPGKEFSIPVDAESTPAGASNLFTAAVPGATPTTTSGASSGFLLQTPRQRANTRNRETTPALGTLNINWKWITPHEAEMEWPFPLREKADLRVEVRKLSFNDDKKALAIAWLPFPNSEAQQTNQGITVRFKKLTPQTLYTVRLVPVNSATGAPMDPLGQFQFQTPAEHHTRLMSVVLFVLVAALGVLLWRQVVPRLLGR